MRLRMLSALLTLASLLAGPAAAAEPDSGPAKTAEPPASSAGTPAAKDSTGQGATEGEAGLQPWEREVIGQLELLQNLELLEQMEVVEDLPVLLGGEEP